MTYGDLIFLVLSVAAVTFLSRRVLDHLIDRLSYRWSRNTDDPRQRQVAIRARLHWVTYLEILPGFLLTLFVVSPLAPPASSLLIQRITVGPVARTTATTLSTQRGQYYSRLNGANCSTSDGSVLNTAPTGSYVVVDKRVVTKWVVWPLVTTGPMSEQCTTSFRR